MNIEIYEQGLFAKFDRRNVTGIYVPQHTRQPLVDYIVRGAPKGHFLTAVLSNDLKMAVMKADELNREALHAIVGWIYEWAPSDCWGSKKKYEAWVESGGLVGQAEAAKREEEIKT